MKNRRWVLPVFLAAVGLTIVLYYAFASHAEGQVMAPGVPGDESSISEEV